MVIMRRQVLNCLLLIVVLLLPQATVLSQSQVQTVTDADVEAVFSRMSPEARVGQLFVIDLLGTDASEDSTIAQQLGQSHIGGVILSDHNDNFSDGETIPKQIYGLSTALQTLAVTQSQVTQNDPEHPQSGPLPYVPLFIGFDI